MKKNKKKVDSNSESEKEDGDAFIVALATHIGNDTWLIDLGASFHMTCNRNWFSNMRNLMVERCI